MNPIFLAGPVELLRVNTDPISNTVANSSVHPLKVRQELAEGRLDPIYLHGVMHETSHFATFFTPVGKVLGALMCVHGSDPVGFTLDHSAARGVARMGAQADAVLGYFTPLIEGIALFAEFDVSPGESPVASTMSTTAMRLFCMHDIRGAAQAGTRRAPYDFVDAFLRSFRTRAETLERKRRLFDLSLASEDGYLLGYLWVKALWRILVSRCRKLADTDLFLSFLIDFFFSDFELASRLFPWLTDDLSDEPAEEYLRDIEHYIFVERIGSLIAGAAAYVDQYEAYASGRAPGDVSEPACRPGYQNYSWAAHFQLSVTSAFGAVRSMHIMWPDYAAGRHIPRIFVAPAHIEIFADMTFKASNEGCDAALEGPVMEAGRPLSGAAVAGNGSIEAVFLLQSMRVILCVFLGHGLIATIDAANEVVNDPEAVQACTDLSSSLAMEAASVQMAKEFELPEGSMAQAVHASLTARAREKTYDYFASLALGPDDGTAADRAVLQVLDAGGVSALLGSLPGATEWLLRLSLSCAGGGTTFRDAARHWHVDEAAIENQISALNAEVKKLCGKEAFVVSAGAFGFSQF